MISKWKYNYTDEEKGMVLTIQNLKQEIYKLVDANEDINREFSQYKYESKKEIERLNNIIKELEKDIEKQIIFCTNEANGTTNDKYCRIAIQYLKHLKQKLDKENK